VERSPVIGRILVIDDDVDVLDVVGEFLLSAGHLVRTASSGTEAVLALDDSFDVVVLDVALPDHSFRELLRLVRERQPGCRVIIATGYPPEDVAPGLPDAVVGILHKPFTMRALVADIQRALAAPGAGAVQTRSG
jgi:DNA-binding response OmpR family regulator